MMTLWYNFEEIWYLQFWSKKHNSNFWLLWQVNSRSFAKIGCFLNTTISHFHLTSCVITYGIWPRLFIVRKEITNMRHFNKYPHYNTLKLCYLSRMPGRHMIMREYFSFLIYSLQNLQARKNKILYLLDK